MRGFLRLDPRPAGRGRSLCLLREAGFRLRGIPPLDPRPAGRGRSLKASASPPQRLVSVRQAGIRLRGFLRLDPRPAAGQIPEGVGFAAATALRSPGTFCARGLVPAFGGGTSLKTSASPPQLPCGLPSFADSRLLIPAFGGPIPEGSDVGFARVRRRVANTVLEDAAVGHVRPPRGVSGSPDVQVHSIGGRGGC